MKISIPLAMVAAFALAACGETKLDRGLSGAGIGAAGGAAMGALVGGPVLGAAALGGAAGAAVGALTDKKDINLGKAPWNR